MINDQNSIDNEEATFNSLVEEPSLSKAYDLEQRTLEFAAGVRRFVRALKMDLANVEDAKQLVCSSGSVGANYIEAKESFSKKDFLFRIKICKKEVKEARYWLILMDVKNDKEQVRLKNELMQEAGELLKIFSAIVTRTEASEKAAG